MDMTENNTNEIGLNSSSLWSLILFRGILLLLMGIFFISYPMETLLVMVTYMGFYWIFDGVITIVKSFRGRKQNPTWRWGLFAGLVGFIAGLVVVSQPLISTILASSFLVWILAIGAIIYGITELVTGIRLRKEIKGEWSMIGGGILSIIFGIILLSSPFLTAVTIVAVTGWIALVGGITMIFTSFQVKKGLQEAKK
jgi:uncharacterized membrane protein HdeD (DUF308 family)